MHSSLYQLSSTKYITCEIKKRKKYLYIYTLQTWILDLP